MKETHSASSEVAEPDPALRARLSSVMDEGWEIWQRFDTEVRQKDWHPFVAADYERVLQALYELRAPGSRFLEWGSATGVITIMADMLGYEAYGIELDPALVEIARGLAERYDSRAKFAAGSFLPSGYEWRPSDGDGRRGTIGYGTSAYPELGHPLEDFDVVYGYPWSGEAPMMQDLMRCYGGSSSFLLLHGGSGGVRVYQRGTQITSTERIEDGS